MAPEIHAPAPSYSSGGSEAGEDSQETAGASVRGYVQLERDGDKTKFEETTGVAHSSQVHHITKPAPARAWYQLSIRNTLSPTLCCKLPIQSIATQAMYAVRMTTKSHRAMHTTVYSGAHRSSPGRERLSACPCTCEVPSVYFIPPPSTSSIPYRAIYLILDTSAASQTSSVRLS